MKTPDRAWSKVYPSRDLMLTVTPANEHCIPSRSVLVRWRGTVHRQPSMCQGWHFMWSQSVHSREAIPEVSTRKNVPYILLFPSEIRGDPGVSCFMNVTTLPVASSLEHAAAIFDGPGGCTRAVQKKKSSRTCLCVS